MSDEYSEYTADGEDNHPALKKFNRPLAMIKHVAMKALKWAAIGAIAGAVVFGLVGAPFGGLGGFLSSAANFLGLETVGAWFAEKGASAMMAPALKGLTVGLIGGAALGGLKGMAGAGNAADDLAERMVANAEAREARVLNKEMLTMQREQQLMALRQQQAEMGLTPGNVPGMKRGGMELGS